MLILFVVPFAWHRPLEDTLPIVAVEGLARDVFFAGGPVVDVFGDLVARLRVAMADLALLFLIGGRDLDALVPQSVLSRSVNTMGFFRHAYRFREVVVIIVVIVMVIVVIIVVIVMVIAMVIVMNILVMLLPRVVIMVG
jgi:hypothetical protein